MNNIDRLFERLSKKHKSQIVIHKVMSNLRDELIKLENRFIDIFEISDNRVEFRVSERNNEVFYFKLNNREVEFRSFIVENIPFLAAVDPVDDVTYVAFHINSSEELTPLRNAATPHDYSIHISEVVDFVIGVVCFNLEYDTKETVLQ